MQTWGEHANSTQKGPTQIMDLEMGPSCCETTVLTIVLPVTALEGPSSPKNFRAWGKVTLPN